MAQLAESHKVAARLELDKLHRGLVGELDKKIVETATSHIAENGDVGLAVKLVQDAVGALNSFRSTLKAQKIELADGEARIEQLEKTINDEKTRVETMESQMQAVHIELRNVKQAVEKLEFENKGLLENKKKLEADLKLLVGSITNSFSSLE